jgi:hypothetical protein
MHPPRASYVPMGSVLLIAVAILCAASDGSADELDRTGTLWAPYMEWSVENPAWSGNPFDVEARVTFTHPASGEERTTLMFYDGGKTWKFRFTATRTGEWSFRTSSDDGDLDGKRGTVAIGPNPDQNVKGFLVPHQNKYARQADEDGTLEAIAPNIYMNMVKFGVPERCGWTAVTPTFSDRETFAAYLDEAEAHGCNAVFARMGNQWFQAQAVSWRDHDSKNPDPATFRAMEESIVQAHQRGMFLHMWAWGDEQRGWTPVGVGGINGEPDRRLQRYMAARLGPLPGWTMSYGSDLNEWANTEQVASWAEYIKRHSGWEPMLSARQVTRGREQFQSPEILTVAAYDDTPADAFYELSIERLSRAPQRPVLFERRFTYLRDGVWDMETTRRAFWQFTLAGGAGAVWGHYPAEGNCSARFEGEYPHPEQLRTHRRFWRDRFLLDMQPDEDRGRAAALVLRSGNQNAVFYLEDAASIELDLTAMAGPQPVIAVDAAKDYVEVDLGTFAAERRTWTAPYRSDWALAVGSFSKTADK